MKHFFKEYGWAFLIVVAIAIVALLFVFLPKKAGEKPNFSTSTPTIVKGADLISQNITEHYAPQNADITVVYPHVVATILVATSTADKINASIDAKINGIISDFKDNLVSVHQDSSKNNKVVAYGTSTLDISYLEEPHAVLQNTISFSFKESYYYDGAAHPESIVETFNYDTRDGHYLALTDLFGPFNAALKDISDYSIASLKNSADQGDQNAADEISAGAGPDVNNFSAFILTDKVMTIFFDQCQVASCAAGIQQVLIPYSELLQFALPGSVLDSVRGTQ